MLLLMWFSTGSTVPCPAIDPQHSSDQLRIEVIECSQKNGDLKTAASLLDRLVPTPVRDTLMLRQLILCDSLPAAQRLADTTRTLNRMPKVRLNWQIRIALFSGKTDKCDSLLDSAATLMRGAPTAEHLEYRYWLLRLAESPEALARFAQIEYTLFRGNRPEAAKLACSAGLDSASAWRLAALVARNQLENNEAAAAVTTLGCVRAEGEPEFLYLMASAENASGRAGTARSIVQRLLLEYPAGTYTVKARLLLSKLPPVK